MLFRHFGAGQQPIIYCKTIHLPDARPSNHLGPFDLRVLAHFPVEVPREGEGHVRHAALHNEYAYKWITYATEKRVLPGLSSGQVRRRHPSVSSGPVNRVNPVAAPRFSYQDRVDELDVCEGRSPGSVQDVAIRVLTRKICSSPIERTDSDREPGHVDVRRGHEAS